MFGESAGAILISQLYLCPSINLFKSAIMESGAPSSSPLGPTSSTWQGPYDSVVKLTNCSSTNNQSTFDCLKALPVDVLLAAQVATTKLPQYSAGFVFGPSIDGNLIPDSPNTLLQEGKFAKIPFISGNNLDE